MDTIQLKTITVKEYNNFAKDLELGVIEQFEKAFKNFFAIKGAIMPDAHVGYTLPIGSIIGVWNALVPSWIGFDIGCGMSAIKLPLSKNDLTEDMKKLIYENICKYIPVGKKKNNTITDIKHLYEEKLSKRKKSAFLNVLCNKNVDSDIGTLGGGNHFIEIGYDTKDNSVWIVVHSGSRGLGYKTATHYLKLAKNNSGSKSIEDSNPLYKGTQEFKDYLKDLYYAQEFALLNRECILERTINIIKKIKYFELVGSIEKDKSFINRNHNHAEKDVDSGLWIHRKGATQAHKGMMGVIPGNMKDGSFIVRGKGNIDSLKSSSHGAGRVLSRTKAKEILNMEDFEKSMKGIKASVYTRTIDESPKAYKDIFKVMEMQKDLVDVVDHIKPLINVKG